MTPRPMQDRIEPVVVGPETRLIGFVLAEDPSILPEIDPGMLSC